MKLRIATLTCLLLMFSAALPGVALANPLCGLEVLGHRPCFQLP
jgi:hypothetical protein